MDACAAAATAVLRPTRPVGTHPHTHELANLGAARLDDEPRKGLLRSALHSILPDTAGLWETENGMCAYSACTGITSCSTPTYLHAHKHAHPGRQLFFLPREPNADMLSRRSFLQAVLAVQKRIERGVVEFEGGSMVGWGVMSTSLVA